MGIVVVLGSFITDLVAQAPRLPHLGESLIGDDFATFFGGKGINQAIAAKRLGAQVTLIGRVGVDTFGDGFFPILEQEGMASTYVERDENVGTGVSVLVIAEDSGLNTIVAIPRANLAVPAETVERALQEARQNLAQTGGQAVFLCQCETSRESYETGLRRAREMGMVTILNAAPIPRDPVDDALLSLVDILVVNEVEAAGLSQVLVDTVEAAQKAAEVLLKRGPQQILITLGAQGSLWCKLEQGTVIHQNLPVFHVKAVDSTAAGDTFCGALAASLSDGMDMAGALRRASAAAAVTVTRRGAIAALPTASEVDELLRSV